MKPARVRADFPTDGNMIPLAYRTDDGFSAKKIDRVLSRIDTGYDEMTFRCISDGKEITLMFNGRTWTVWEGK